MKKSFLLTVHGTTTATTSGTLSLYNRWFENAVTAIQIEKGMTIKLWSLEISGAIGDILINTTEDNTAGSPTFVERLRYSQGQTFPALIIDKNNRPIPILTSSDGKQAVNIGWSQSVAATMYVNATFEVTWED